MPQVFIGTTEIRIPQDSLILICGSQNSGKTTFTTKHFDTQYVVNTDQAFEDVINHQTTCFDTKDTILEKTTDLFEERLRAAITRGPYTVVDAAPVEFQNRVAMLNEFKGFRKNIILIVLDIKYPTLISRPRKKPTANKLKHNFVPAPDEELLMNAMLITAQISRGQIGYKTTRTYVLSEKDVPRCKVILE